MAKLLADPVTLPCGLVFKNRLIKAAMAENMSKDQAPNDNFTIAYEAWGRGGFGGILPGNVQINEKFLGSPGDLAFVDLDNPEVKEKWKQYAAACRVEGTPTIVQVCHTGRQSLPGSGTRGFFEKTVAPSPIPLSLGDSLIARLFRSLLLGTPREMSTSEIHEMVRKFAEAAKFLAEVGFDGIQLHAAHGYLLSLFMSSTLNQRQDSYGGSPENRVRVVVEIIKAIREVAPPNFAVGIKMNSVDLQHSGDLTASMQQIQLIIDAGIDFLEISGGTFEDPQMMGRDQPTARTAAREAFFLDFAKAVRSKFPHVVLMVTGGFRTLAGMRNALDSDACDLIGIGRPTVINPSWPKELLEKERQDASTELKLAPVQPALAVRMIPIKALGAGAESAYYQKEIHRMSKGLPTRPPGGVAA
ncbi:hypothetical protein ACN47E_009194 [Coniothyrium glycines]